MDEPGNWVCFRARAGTKQMLAWAWYNGAPGFTQLVLTTTDGMAPAEIPEGDSRVVLEQFLFAAAGETLGGYRGDIECDIDTLINATSAVDVVRQVLEAVGPERADQVLSGALDRVDYNRP